MIRVYIFADSHKHFSSALEEYKKRLGKMIDIIELKPIRKGTPQQIVELETKLLIEKLQKETGYKIVLSPTGKNISTEDMNTIIEHQKVSGRKVVFVIGGANGLNYILLKPSIDFEISLGKMIIPHSLALTVLLEQIYRCSEITKGSAYHK